MKHYKNTSLLLWVLLFSFAEARGGHVLGSELLYSFTGSNTIQLDLKVYRDCSECKFNGTGGGHNPDNCSEIPPVEVYGVTPQGQKVLLTTAGLTYQSIENITKTCGNYTNGCGSSANPDFAGGVEVHNLQAFLDIQSYTQQGYCHFYFASSIFSRSNAITPPNNPIPKFFNYSEVNTCSGIRSNSAELSVHPNFFVSTNSPVYHTLGIVPADADSISVQLVPALSGFEEIIPYHSGRNYLLPLSVNCFGADCVSEPYVNPPVGFFVHNQTGNTVFTPQSAGETGTLVYEVKKWKKNSAGQLVVAGTVRRDFQIQTISNGNKEPAFENYLSDYTLCSGVGFVLPVPVHDNQAVTYTVSNLIPGMSFTQNGISNPPYNTGVFSWTPPASAVGKFYFVTVEVRDNNCPLNAVSSRTFKLKVHSNPQLSVLLKQKACGKIEMEGLPATFSNNQYMWKVTYPNTVSNDYWGRKHEIEHLSGGKLYIELSLNQACKGTVRDSVSLPKFVQPAFSLRQEYVACLGKNVTVTPLNLVGNAPFEYFWNNNKGTQVFMREAGANYPLTLQVVDKDGCQNKVSATVKSFPVLYPVASDTSFCAYDEGKLVLNNLLENNFGKSFGFEAIGSGTQLLNQNGEWYFMKENFNRSFINFRVWVQDGNACRYYDTFTIFKTSGLDVAEISGGTFCRFSDKVNLFSRYGLKDGDGYFESDIQGAIENGKVLNPAAFSQSGIFEIRLVSAPKYCSKIFTREIEIVNLPDISWVQNIPKEVCTNSNPLDLGGQLMGGVWQGAGVQDFTFNPRHSSVVAGKTYPLRYTLTEVKSGCVVADSATVSVWEAPAFTVQFSDSSGLLGEESVCIDKKMYVELVPAYNTEHFPHTFSTILTANKGTLNGTLLNFDTEGGLHTVSLTTENPLCPASYSSGEIRVEKMPEITVSYATNVFCDNKKEMLLDFATQNTQKTAWYLNDSLAEVSGEKAGTFAIKLPHTGNFSLSATLSNAACTHSQNLVPSIVVHPVPEPVIYASPSQYVPYDLRVLVVQDKGEYHAPVVKRIWQIENSEYENNISFTHPVQTEDGEVTVRLYVADTNGCEAEASSTLYISPPLDIYIPNAFSPDGKGPESNNLFKVNADHAQEFQMMIINRWGEIVYSSRNASEGWDGTFLGEDCSTGTYAYYIKVVNHLGGTREFRGTLTLLR